MITNSFKGIASIILTVALIGLVAGLSIAGSDLANPWTSQAAAAQRQAETAHETEKNAIDRHYYAQEREMQARAQEIRINEQIAYQQRMDAIKLKLADIGGKVAIGLLAYLVVLSVSLFFWNRLQQMLKRQEAALKRSSQQYTPVYLRPRSTSSRNGNGRVHYPAPQRTIPARPHVNA